MAENSCVVIDLGSQDIKAGFANSFPSEYEPQIVCKIYKTKMNGCIARCF